MKFHHKPYTEKQKKYMGKIYIFKRILYFILMGVASVVIFFVLNEKLKFAKISDELRIFYNLYIPFFICSLWVLFVFLDAKINGIFERKKELSQPLDSFGIFVLNEKLKSYPELQIVVSKWVSDGVKLTRREFLALYEFIEKNN